MKSPVTITLEELNDKFDEYMDLGLSKPVGAKGFTIGRGKKLYWYIVYQSAKNGLYMVTDSEARGWPRFISGKQKVTVHYNQNLGHERK